MDDNNLKKIPRKIALVHEWFSPKSKGGAESVVKEIDKIFIELGLTPQLFSLVDGESKLKDSWLFKRPIKTSFIQKLPFGISNVQNYLPLLPLAIEQLNLDEFPLVISSSHLVAKGVLTSPDQLHISYVHTPVRYAWDQMNIYLRRSNLHKLGLEPLIRLQLYNLRQWDQLSSARVDCFLANSRFTARRIAKFWRRKSEVVHPPVSVHRFSYKEPRDDYYLSICRLVPNKRVELLIRAFNHLKLPLIIVGEGVEKKYLEGIAGPTIQLMGYQSQEEVTYLMEHCRAFVYAGIEDFGIAPVEAMAAGSPVIGLGRGGLLDTVKCINRFPGEATGLLFPDPTVSSLSQAINMFVEKRMWKDFSSTTIRSWANNFSEDAFSLRFKAAIARAWNNHKSSCDIDSSDLDSFLKLSKRS